MIDLASMAHHLTSRTHHRYEDWHDLLTAVLHDPAFSQMTDGEIDLLVNSLESPAQLSWLLNVFQQAHQSNSTVMPFDFLVRQVKGSPFNLRDWILALHTVYNRSGSDSGQFDLFRLADFVSEATRMAAGVSQDLSLIEIVDAMVVSRGLEKR